MLLKMNTETSTDWFLGSYHEK